MILTHVVLICSLSCSRGREEKKPNARHTFQKFSTAVHWNYSVHRLGFILLLDVSLSQERVLFTFSTHYWCFSGQYVLLGAEEGLFSLLVTAQQDPVMEQEQLDCLCCLWYHLALAWLRVVDWWLSDSVNACVLALKVHTDLWWWSVTMAWRNRRIVLSSVTIHVILSFFLKK